MAAARAFDSDLDGLSDFWEQALRQNPRLRDTDNDGIPNALDRNIDGGVANTGPHAGRYIGDRRAHQRNSIARPLPHSPSILPLQQRRMPDLRGAQPIRTGRNPDALQIQSSNSVPPDNLFPGSRPEMSQPVQVE